MRHNKSNFVVDPTEVEAVATGVTQQAPVVRKGRVRKAGARNAAVAIKKKKEPKKPRNPFRRSDTDKLRLKKLQMGKRVETMTPRVDILRSRLEIMQKRLDYVSDKLKFVNEELDTRSLAAQSVSTGDSAGANATGPVVYVDESASGDDSAEVIELDDEVEDTVQEMEVVGDGLK